jgi:hypothetical protein
VKENETDPQLVERILDEMKGMPTQLIADRIARNLGERIQQRQRDSEDFSFAAARIEAVQLEQAN